MWFWSNMIHSFTTTCRCDFCILMLANRNPKWKSVQWRSNTFPRASAVVTKSSRYRTWKHTRIRIYGNLLPASCTYNLFYKNKPSDLWKPLFSLHRSKLQGLICQDYPGTEKLDDWSRCSMFFCTWALGIPMWSRDGWFPVPFQEYRDDCRWLPSLLRLPGEEEIDLDASYSIQQFASNW